MEEVENIHGSKITQKNKNNKGLLMTTDIKEAANYFRKQYKFQV